MTLSTTRFALLPLLLALAHHRALVAATRIQSEALLRGSIDNVVTAETDPLPRPTRILQIGGDLGPTIVPIVNNILASQVSTINSNIQGAITDPITIGQSGTIANVGTITVPMACTNAPVSAPYTLDSITGTASTTEVNNITLSSFQGLTFATNSCELKLADSGIRFISTGTAYTLTGTFTAQAQGTCVADVAYTFTSTITNTIYDSVATLAFGGTTSNVAITNLALTGFTLTTGTVSTTTSPDITADANFGSIGATLITEINNQVTNYLNGDLKTQLETEFRNALNTVVAIWRREGYPSSGDIPQSILDEAGVVMPSRWEIAKLWAESFFGL